MCTEITNDPELLVSFDKPKLKRLIKAYNHACDMGVDTFIFEGRGYLVVFTTYLIQYLTSKLK